MTTDILTKLAALTAKDENGCLPCPFCAKPPDVDRYDSRIMGMNFQVECANPHCPVETGTCAHQSRDDAINHWNSRHADPSIIALVKEAAGEIERLKALINTPELVDFSKAVHIEAVHQRERWGNEHDESKEAWDWYWLIGYVASKAVHALKYGDNEKALHHVITTAAVANNWHSAVLKEQAENTQDAAP